MASEDKAKLKSGSGQTKKSHSRQKAENISATLRSLAQTLVNLEM